MCLQWFDIPRYSELGPASLALMANEKNIEVRRYAIQMTVFSPKHTDLPWIVGEHD